MTVFEDARREVLASFEPAIQRVLVKDELVFEVSADSKVSCRFSRGACSSPSKCDPAKPRAWVCGSSFSHVKRMGCCVAYRRLDAGLAQGVSGNRRFPK